MKKFALIILRSCVFSFLLIATISNLQGQVKPLTSSEILLHLKKLNVVGSAMHIAAHPDDENTLLLTYLSKERLVRSHYLSLTRGDGGQNLIGPEQGEYIGVIRTQELLAARRIDGAEQLFTRAYDFGFSKTREETLKLWGETNILSDVVYLIRKYQPDVLITRFPPDARAGHGHHNSSAYLAEVAFKLSGDPAQFPEQLAHVQVWQPKRIVWNTFSPGFNNQRPTDKGSFITVEIGGYNTYIGKSYAEIAAESRSQHKSQGFGSAANRNTRIDFMLHKDGTPADKDLFDGIDISWGRIKGSEPVAQLIDQAIRNYNVHFPASSVPVLVKIYQELDKLSKLHPQNIYISQKKQEVETLLQNCLGLWFETNPTDYATTPGDYADLRLNVVKRAHFPARLIKVQTLGANKDTTVNIDLKTNELSLITTRVQVPTNTPISQPYWLTKPIQNTIFQIENQTILNTPENVPTLQTAFTFEIGGQLFTFTKPWVFKSTDPVEGEVYRPYEVRPAVTANVTEKVYVFADNQPKMVDILIKTHRANSKGNLRFELPAGWRCEPASIPFDLPEKYQEQLVSVKVFPSNKSEEVKLKVVIQTESGTTSHSLKVVEYKHIPTQTLYPVAHANLVKLDIKNKATNIGYIAGAGDEVPAALRQMGCKVTLLDEGELNKNLNSYDAIVVGVRAYNTEERMRYFQPKLMEYVKNGGTMVVQYATAGGFGNTLKVPNIGPYPFKIGRDRVTEEEAEVRILQPNHPVLNTPNKISPRDFEGWIQERGIYFAVEWDKNYVPLFSMNDTNEAAKEGSTIYCSHGKGHFIYTGLSFFRELPAGVSGAYRLFANMISLSKK
ncbi:MAG: PIG-L family deacetylase [Runella sp.]